MSESTKELFCQPVYERALLSYCFKSVNNYYTVFSQVSEDDFLRIDHRLLYMILGVLANGVVGRFDSSMVLNEAKKNGILDQIGGYGYINAIIGLELDLNNLSFYISRVLDNSTKYQLYCQLGTNLEMLKDRSKDDDVTSLDLLGKVGNDVMDLSMKSKAVKEATNLADGIDEYIEERRGSPIEYCGMSTGFSILDKRIDGLIPGTLQIVCARPKNGKSTFLSVVSTYVAYELHEPVLYIDTEMSFDQWRSRILSMLSGVEERRIKHGGYSDQEYHNIKQASKVIKSGKLFHEYMPGYSIDKLVTVYKKYKHSEDIKLGVFDYIKSPSNADFKNKKEYQLLGDVTTALKDLAGELDLPIFAANQINRQQDIADSDRILRYADVLMLLKPKTPDEIQQAGISGGTYKLQITDSRRGGTTPEEGIGFNFYKRSLQMTEAKVQVIDYDSGEYKEQENFMYDDDTSDNFNDDKMF